MEDGASPWSRNAFSRRQAAPRELWWRRTSCSSNRSSRGNPNPPKTEKHLIKCFNSTSDLLKAPRAPSPAQHCYILLMAWSCSSASCQPPAEAGHWHNRTNTGTTRPTPAQPVQHWPNQSSTGPMPLQPVQHQPSWSDPSPTRPTPARPLAASCPAEANHSASELKNLVVRKKDFSKPRLTRIMFSAGSFQPFGACWDSTWPRQTLTGQPVPACRHLLAQDCSGTYDFLVP